MSGHYQRVKQRFPAAVLEVVEKAIDPFIVIDPAAIIDVGRFLRDDPDTAMDCL